MYLDARSAIPLHHTWARWLWDRGLQRQEILPLDTSGILAYHCVPAFDELKSDITDGIISRHLTVPR